MNNRFTRQQIAPPGFGKAVFMILGFMLWLGGAIFLIPAVLAEIDLSTGWVDLITAGVLLLPVTVLVAFKGGGRPINHRRERTVFFAGSTIVFLAAALAAAVGDQAVGATFLLYTGLFQGAVLVATVRSTRHQGHR